MLKKYDDIDAAMLNYRNTPQEGHTYSPVQRFMNHRTCTLLPTSNHLLKSEIVDTSIVTKEIQMKRQRAANVYNPQATNHAEFEIGTYAYAKPPPHKRGNPWMYGQITDKNDNRSYNLKTPISTIRRNRVYLRAAAAPSIPLQHKVVYVNKPSINNSSNNTDSKNIEMMHTPQVPSNSESAMNTDRICNDQDQGHSIHSHAEPVSTSTDSHNNIPDTRSNSDQVWTVRPKRECRLPIKYSDYDMR